MKKYSDTDMLSAVNDFVRKCPAIGNNKPFMVYCDNKPIAGFNTLSEAEAAKISYSFVNKRGSPSESRNWRVERVS